MAETSEMLQ